MKHVMLLMHVSFLIASVGVTELLTTSSFSSSSTGAPALLSFLLLQLVRQLFFFLFFFIMVASNSCTIFFLIMHHLFRTGTATGGQQLLHQLVRQLFFLLFFFKVASGALSPSVFFFNGLPATPAPSSSSSRWHFFSDQNWYRHHLHFQKVHGAN